MSKHSSIPLKIGMPVYNGGRFIRQALESLVGQTYADWELLIADNASDDDTQAISREFMARDRRIGYVRHDDNVGAAANFKYVLDWADSPYFMWAASDDVWGAEFINACVDRLEKAGGLGMAFTGLGVIDTYGQSIRQCPDIPGFSGSADYRTIGRYVLTPEFSGKANLIYSVFRTSICKLAFERFPFINVWGADMCFNIAAMSIGGVQVVPEVHFYKRDARSTDLPGAPVPVVIPKGLRAKSCPLTQFSEYTGGMLTAVRGTRFYPLVYALMWLRRQQLKRLPS